MAEFADGVGKDMEAPMGLRLLRTEGILCCVTTGIMAYAALWWVSDRVPRLYVTVDLLQ